VIVLAGGDAEAVAVARLLEAVGFRNLRGYVAGGMPAWRSAGLEVATIPALDVAGLAARLAAGEARLLDVREADEYERAHVPGSLHVPYHDLRGEVPAEVADADGPLAVACSAGNRSAVAASALVARGVQRIEHVADGGVADLADHGIALRRGGGGSGGP
jgi:hydroxyacylglutathione hydrolase